MRTIIKSDINPAAIDLSVLEEVLLQVFSKNGAQTVQVIFDEGLPSKKKERFNAEGLLGVAYETMKERNQHYNSAYRKAGKIMHQYFPNGITLCGEEDMQRFIQFIMCTSKMNRYSESLEMGGHFDSALDLINFAAMLTEASQESVKQYNYIGFDEDDNDIGNCNFCGAKGVLTSCHKCNTGAGGVSFKVA